jgi:hypothetical protein
VQNLTQEYAKFIDSVADLTSKADNEKQDIVSRAKKALSALK